MTIISSQHFIFQSTPSLRKATLRIYAIPTIPAISIHTFLAEGDFDMDVPGTMIVLFQSTPSLRKATLVELAEIKEQELFQSTPSLRKATSFQAYRLLDSCISIHTFLAEGD